MFWLRNQRSLTDTEGEWPEGTPVRRDRDHKSSHRKEGGRWLQIAPVSQFWIGSGSTLFRNQDGEFIKPQLDTQVCSSSFALIHGITSSVLWIAAVVKIGRQKDFLGRHRKKRNDPFTYWHHSFFYCFIHSWASSAVLSPWERVFTHLQCAFLPSLHYWSREANCSTSHKSIWDVPFMTQSTCSLAINNLTLTSLLLL